MNQFLIYTAALGLLVTADLTVGDRSSLVGQVLTSIGGHGHKAGKGHGAKAKKSSSGKRSARRH